MPRRESQLAALYAAPGTRRGSNADANYRRSELKVRRRMSAVDILSITRRRSSMKVVAPKIDDLEKLDELLAKEKVYVLRNPRFSLLLTLSN